MKLSITLPAIYREQGISLSDAYQALFCCGFRNVSITLHPDVSRESFQQEAQAVLTAGMNVTSIRAEGNPFSSAKAQNAMRSIIALAGEHQIPAVILPLGTETDIGHYEYMDRNEAYLRDMLSEAEKTDTRILFDNAGSYQIAHYAHHAREIRLLTERINHSLLGVNLNTGNLGLSEAQPYPQIKLLGDLVQGVDISDNFGAMPLAVHPERQDMQFAPLMGSIDFDQVMQALTEIHFQGVCNLSVNLPKAEYTRYASTGRVKYSLSIVNRLYAWVFHIATTMLRAYDVYEAE